VQKTRGYIKAFVRVRRGRRLGFTLIELLVVVAIIALVSGMGAGLYRGTYERVRVERVVRDFLLTAKYGRIMAIEKQRPYKIQIDEENGGFFLSTTEWNEAAEETEETVVKDYYCKPVEFEGNIKFEDIQIIPAGDETESEDEEKQSIVFRPDGTAQQVVIQIGDGQTHYAVSISAATGKAKTYFGTAEDVEIGTIDLDAQ